MKKFLISCVFMALCGAAGNRAGDLFTQKEESASEAIRSKIRYSDGWKTWSLGIRHSINKDQVLYIREGWIFATLEVDMNNISNQFTLRDRYRINCDAKAKHVQLTTRLMKELQ